MSDTHLFEKCRAYLTSSTRPGEAVNDHLPRAAITLSRQVGARGTTVGQHLVELLNDQQPTPDPLWTLFDKNLIRRVLDDHHLPGYLERFMTESRVSELQSTINEIVGLHPSLWDLHEKMGDTVVRLLTRGHSIIVGRGACVVGAGLRNVLNVRLIGSTKHRLMHIQHKFSLTTNEAAARLREDDRNRHDYFKAHFGREIDDPELYHLVLNTDDLADEEIAGFLADAAMRHARAKFDIVV
ncbi:MAG: cytidylate kinase-like family protein [Verrucomicrobiota bacterium]